MLWWLRLAWLCEWRDTLWRLCEWWLLLSWLRLRVCFLLRCEWLR